MITLVGTLTLSIRGIMVGRGDCIGQEIMGRTDADPRRDLIRQSEANHSQDYLGWSHEKNEHSVIDHSSSLHVFNCVMCQLI